MSRLLVLVTQLAYSLCLWRIFSAMGIEKAWRGLIPFYNIYVLYSVLLNRMYADIYIALTIITIAVPSQSGLIILLLNLAAEIILAGLSIISMYRLGMAFGKSKAYSIALVIISPVMLFLLAFVNNSKYIGVEPLRNPI